MKFFLRPFLLSAVATLGFAFPFAAFAQESTPAPVPPAAASDDTKPAPPPAVSEAAPAATPASVETPKSEMRRLDVAPDATPAEKREVVPPEPASPAKPKPAKPAKRPKRSGTHDPNNDRVNVMGETHVLADEKVDGSAVAVMGDVVVDGEVFGDAVSVMGSNTINGTVNGKAVAVMGDVHLGPNAVVTGDVVCVGGTVHRAAGSEIGGRIVKTPGPAGHTGQVGPGLESWWVNGLRLGRPLAIGPSLHWQWILTVCLLAFYALLALLFPEGIRKTGDLLARRSLAVVMSGFLSLLAIPVLFVLLLITIVGIPVALLLLPLGAVLGVLYGKAAIYGLVGRTLSNDKLLPPLAVLIGAVPFVLLYLVPIVGMMLWILVALLGLGCAVTAMFTSEKKTGSSNSPFAPAVPASPFVVPPAPPAPAASVEDVLASPGFVAPAPIQVPKRPAFSAVALPRAGFWIRAAALFIDLILIAVIFGPMGLGQLIPPALAIYAALMWATKGTTIGGVICNLCVVRLDDRPIDWATAIVRALGCFLSLAVVGLGFVWVAFDDQKQSWHDKIAGTTVVRTPKGTSLL